MGVNTCIPMVKISDDGNGSAVWRQDSEHKSINSRALCSGENSVEIRCHCIVRPYEGLRSNS